MPSGTPWSRSKWHQVLDEVSAGAGVKTVARSHGIAATTVHQWWHEAGGPPLLKGRRGGALTSAGVRPGGRGHRLSRWERGVIERGLHRGLTLAVIGGVLGRDRTVIWREVARHRGPRGYHAGVADARAVRASLRPKQFRLAGQGLAEAVSEYLDQGWSPGLIAAWLRHEHPQDRSQWVSHETIYQALYVQTRGQLRADLYKCLSLARPARKTRGHPDGRSTPRFGQALQIAQRPPSVKDRAVPGHWEGDLIIGSGSSAIGTLVERTTRFTILLHLPTDHTAETVAAAMLEAMKDLPGHLRRSLTWDRGVELARYEQIQLDLQMPVYFADPYSPWQRGTNENTNRLLRFWFTKGSDLRVHTAQDLALVAATLNARPRPTLDLKTPAQALAELLEAAA